MAEQKSIRGDIAFGRGSKWHLLRFMGWHRNQLDQVIRKEIPGAGAIVWMDMNWNPRGKQPDVEIRALDFLPKAKQMGWDKFWPSRGNTHNWDGVGIIKVRGRDEWILVEAKAHVGELISRCGASSRGGLGLIKRSLAETKQALGVDPQADWLQPYYQYGNRLAVLHFLVNKAKIPTRLVMVYFTGDRGMGSKCPKNKVGWLPAIQEMESHLGIANGHRLQARVHKVFLNVRDPNVV